MTIAPFDLILLLGSIQGFILATLLWTNKNGYRLSNQLLAVLIGLLALMSLAMGIPIFNRWVGFALDFLPLIMAMPVGPLVYFYAQSILEPTFRLGHRERRHFYPVVLDWCPKIIGWIFLGGLFIGLLPPEDGPAWGSVMNEFNTYADVPRWLSLTTYLLLTRRWLSQHEQVSTDKRTLDRIPTLRWLRQFINVFLIFQVIWLVHLVPYIIPGTRSALLDKFGWYPIYIPISVLIYWLGLKGYLHTRSLASENPLSKAPSTLPTQLVLAIIDSLSVAMERDRLYLDPDLTTDKLARHIRQNPKLISAVLNQHIGKNFNGYVNEYRINEVKRRLISPDYNHLTITGIAFESGFNSQATFQRTFKQATGQSPRDYVASHKTNNARIGI